MKKAFALSLTLAIAAGLSGCAKEDEVRGLPYPPLVGTWKLVQKTVPNDSSFTIKKIEDPASQTLTFESDGKMSSTGEETSYYRSGKAYRVDSTRKGQQIGFLPGSIYAAFYQNFLLRNDSLYLLPCPSRECDLIFVKGR